jgi:multidrug efflux pump subunit AcrA (membrane-fusion protein)
MSFIAIGLVAAGGGGWATYHYGMATEVQIPVAPVRKGEFTIRVRTRGDIKSVRSASLNAPQVPGLRILRLATNGAFVHKGDVVVQFDRESQVNNLLTRQNAVTSANGSIDTAKASQARTLSQDALSKMQAEYNLEEAKLEASKAQVVSAIQGEKSRIAVGTSESSLVTVKSGITADVVDIRASMMRYEQARDNAVKNLDLTQTYLTQMDIKAPTDGVVNLMTNFRAQGTFGRGGAPPFKEGDNVWTGAQIAEIPDLSSMYIDLKLDEVDRGRIALGQEIKLRVDSIPDKDFEATLDSIAPAAALVFTGVGSDMSASSQKYFPARGTLKAVDDRLRPGTSASVEIIIERQQDVVMIPLQANFDVKGKPVVYVQNGKDFTMRQVQVGKKNEDYIVVTGGLRGGESVALVDPTKAKNQGKKKT